jgi:hypothetical protein
VDNQSDQNTDSYTKFPFSYSDITGKGNISFTGHYDFSINEIKVFMFLFKTILYENNIIL